MSRDRRKGTSRAREQCPLWQDCAMTLDESPNWAHAAANERGDALPEVTAASRVASMLGRYITPAWFSEAALQMLAGKVIAHRHALIPLFAELDADPKRLGPRGTVLRQQQTASLSDEDSILERLGEIERDLPQLEAERSKLRGFLRGLGSVYAEPDPDERGADEDSERIAQERRDDEAAAGMPKGMTA